MTPDAWKLVASIGGLLLTSVTAPFLWALRAEGRAIRKEIELAHSQLKLDMTAMEGRLKLDMAQMEIRLNERIDTKLVLR